MTKASYHYKVRYKYEFQTHCVVSESYVIHIIVSVEHTETAVYSKGSVL